VVNKQQPLRQDSQNQCIRTVGSETDFIALTNDIEEKLV